MSRACLVLIATLALRTAGAPASAAAGVSVEQLRHDLSLLADRGLLADPEV